MISKGVKTTPELTQPARRERFRIRTLPLVYYRTGYVEKIGKFTKCRNFDLSEALIFAPAVASIHLFLLMNLEKFIDMNGKVHLSVHSPAAALHVAFLAF
jgi:hypothetical protein